MALPTVQDALDFCNDGVALFEKYRLMTGPDEPLGNVEVHTDFMSFLSRAQHVVGPLLTPRPVVELSQTPVEEPSQPPVEVLSQAPVEELSQTTVEEPSQAPVEELHEVVAGEPPNEEQAQQPLDAAITERRVESVGEEPIDEDGFSIAEEVKSLMATDAATFWATSFQSKSGSDFYARACEIALTLSQSNVLYRFFAFAAYEHFFKLNPGAQNVTAKRASIFCLQIGLDIRGKSLDLDRLVELLSAGKKLYEFRIDIDLDKFCIDIEEPTKEQSNYSYAFLVLKDLSNTLWTERRKFRRDTAARELRTGAFQKWAVASQYGTKAREFLDYQAKLMVEAYGSSKKGTFKIGCFQKGTKRPWAQISSAIGSLESGGLDSDAAWLTQEEVLSELGRGVISDPVAPGLGHQVLAEYAPLQNGVSMSSTCENTWPQNSEYAGWGSGRLGTHIPESQDMTFEDTQGSDTCIRSGTLEQVAWCTDFLPGIATLI